MKQVLITITAVFVFFSPQLSFGQAISFRFSDLFGQNKKERNNTLAQIAQLQLYLNAARQGYTIVKDGLSTIHQVRNGEFTIHDLYYLSKKQVNPVVRRYPAALQALNYNLDIQRSLDRFLRLMRRDTVLAGHQRSFLRNTCAAVATDSDNLTRELHSILTDGRLEMNDAERIRRIEDLASRSQRKLMFTKTFCTEACSLVTSRMSETMEGSTLTNLYDLKK
ncbi:hypothetical protein [Chitinophaga barathri]|uniref:TerB family tellurite resistance protein n=1 Tax=Chitinophaga barathri TaxID=1647451 RepID=A0A3N4MSH7_9BACT|nr:hypothetical protein [Chitinophaga barathri]RPD43090.1 hypothetical protein EG028_02005 [Chitinophaga barathri]